MAGKKRLSYRRKSFVDDGYKESDGDKPLSGTVGKNLGFWMTAFLGFQTLGSIYGIYDFNELGLIYVGDIGTSPLYVFTGYPSHGPNAYRKDISDFYWTATGRCRRSCQLYHLVSYIDSSYQILLDCPPCR
jgi:hypothetical protein